MRYMLDIPARAYCEPVPSLSAGRMIARRKLQGLIYGVEAYVYCLDDSGPIPEQVGQVTITLWRGGAAHQNEGRIE